VRRRMEGKVSSLERAKYDGVAAGVGIQ